VLKDFVPFTSDLLLPLIAPHLYSNCSLVETAIPPFLVNKKTIEVTDKILLPI